MDKYPGSLKSRAAAAGKSMKDYATENKDADTAVGKLARLYFLQSGVHGNGGDLAVPGDNRKPGNPLYQIG